METKKVLWTALSVVMALAVVSGIALALTYPRGGSAAAPASVAAVAPPRVDSPDAYVRAVEPPQPQAAAPVDAGTDIVIIYGEKPAAASLPGALPGTPSAAAPSAAPAAAQAASPPPGTPAAVAAPPAASSKPYAPAPAAKSTAPAASAASPKPAATAAKPAAKPAAPASIHEYWIQAAAFSSRSRADDLQRDLASKGLSTLITMKDIDGVTWYRVRVGPYRSEAEAKGWLDRIKTMAGCAEAYVSRQASRSS